MAEFQKVIKELRRICGIYDCNACPIRFESGENCNVWIKDHPEIAERIIMEWSAEHPAMTNRQKFREVFGMDIVLVGPSNDWLDQEYKGGRDEQN